MLYPASVPLFLPYLERLDGLVTEAESFATASSREPQEVLQARLAADMLPFVAQVMTAAHFALRACYPLAGRAVPPFAGIPASFAALHRELGSVRERVAALQASEFAGAETRILREKAGEADLELPAWEFLMHFALPNFFFHFTSAYAILRSLGAKIGKADFDGLHSYRNDD